MKLYAIRPYGLDVDRWKTYLKDNFVSLGYPGIGDLENAGREAIRERLAEVYGYSGGELDARTDELALFAGGIRDGDAVLVADGEQAYLGDIGDYYYVEEADDPEDGTCHRRGVTWLRRLARTELNELVTRLLEAPAARLRARPAGRFDRGRERRRRPPDRRRSDRHFEGSDEKRRPGQARTSRRRDPELRSAHLTNTQSRPRLEVGFFARSRLEPGGHSTRDKIKLLAVCLASD